MFTLHQSMFYTRSAKPVTIYACVGVRRKAREILYTTYAQQRLALYEALP